MLNKAKEKVEIIKLDHSKLLKSPFSEERLDEVVYSKLPQAPHPLSPPPPPPQTAEYEGARVKASLEARAGERSVEELQRQLVESLIDIKLRGVL